MKEQVSLVWLCLKFGRSERLTINVCALSLTPSSAMTLYIRPVHILWYESTRAHEPAEGSARLTNCETIFALRRKFLLDRRRSPRSRSGRRDRWPGEESTMPPLPCFNHELSQHPPSPLLLGRFELKNGHAPLPPSKIRITPTPLWTNKPITNLAFF